MKKNYFLVFLCLVSFYLTAQTRVDITKPMWGEVERDANYKNADDEFRKSALNDFGSLDSAVVHFANQGWTRIFNNELRMAMISFNQSWLLNPEFPDAYFGFASLLEMQGRLHTGPGRFTAGLSHRNIATGSRRKVVPANGLSRLPTSRLSWSKRYL